MSNRRIHAVNVVAPDCHNSLIRAEKRLAVAIGAKGFCVAETTDAVPVPKSDQTRRVRETADALQRRGATERLYRTKVNLTFA